MTFSKDTKYKNILNQFEIKPKVKCIKKIDVLTRKMLLRILQIHESVIVFGLSIQFLINESEIK